MKLVLTADMIDETVSVIERENRMAQLLAKILFWLHLIIVAFLVFGFLLPKDYLLLHLWAVPLTILQWWFNKNQCILTQWQQKLEGKAKPQPGEESGFVLRLCEKMGWKPRKKQLILLIYGVLLMSFFLSLAGYGFF